MPAPSWRPPHEGCRDCPAEHKLPPVGMRGLRARTEGIDREEAMADRPDDDAMSASAAGTGPAVRLPKPLPREGKQRWRRLRVVDEPADDQIPNAPDDHPNS